MCGYGNISNLRAVVVCFFFRFYDCSHEGNAHYKFWNEARRFIYDALYTHVNTENDDDEFRTSILPFRTPPPPWHRRPLACLRAFVLHTLMPIGVAMAGADEFDPYRD